MVAPLLNTDSAKWCSEVLAWGRAPLVKGWCVAHLVAAVDVLGAACACPIGEESIDWLRLLTFPEQEILVLYMCAVQPDAKISNLMCFLSCLISM